MPCRVHVFRQTPSASASSRQQQRGFSSPYEGRLSSKGENIGLGLDEMLGRVLGGSSPSSRLEETVVHCVANAARQPPGHAAGVGAGAGTLAADCAPGSRVTRAEPGEGAHAPRPTPPARGSGSGSARGRRGPL